MPSSLAAGAFDCVDAAVILQNHDPAAVRRVPRFCNGLFISLAPNLGRGSNFVFVAEKNEAVKRHSVLPTFLTARVEVEQRFNRPLSPKRKRGSGGFALPGTGDFADVVA